MAKSRRGPAPVPGSPVAIRIESCPAEGKASVRFLGPYVGTFAHFVKKNVRPVPCVGDECPMALHKGRKIWKGYAPAEYWRGGEYGDWCPCVWEVTENLNEVLDAIPLRGTIWEISRVPGDTGKPEVWGVLVRTDAESDLRPAFDTFPMVSRMYGFLPMQWGVACHIPKRLRLEPSKGEAPPNAVPLNTIQQKIEDPKVIMTPDQREASNEIRRGIFPGSERSAFELNGKRKRNGKAVLS
jgi:hypothetical protein